LRQTIMSLFAETSAWQMNGPGCVAGIAQ